MYFLLTKLIHELTILMLNKCLYYFNSYLRTFLLKSRPTDRKNLKLALDFHRYATMGSPIYKWQ